MATYKGVEIDTKPTEAMAKEAQRGLDWRREHGRGGTEVGVARARQLINRQDLSPDTVRRMHSFFSRHEVDKQGQGFSPGEDGYPSAGRIAWALWSGDVGQQWARARVARMDTIDNRAAPDALRVGDFVSWDNPGGRARGRIEQIERNGKINVPDSSFEIEGTDEDPAALIRLYRESEDGYEATDTLVGHKFSTLTKIEALRSAEETRGLVDAARSALISSQSSEADMDKRHIVGITEDEGTVTVVFAKAEMEETEIEGTNELMEAGIYEGTVFPADRKGEPILHRADSMDAEVKEDRRVRMAISSETPVERGAGTEILDHSSSSIDLSFLNSGRAPLLVDHDPTQQIGVIESVSLDESARKLRAVVRFGKGERACEIYDDVVDGIRGNVSIGYYVKKVARAESGYRATSWQPMEVSVVSIPADPTVGVGRSAEIPPTVPAIPKKEIKMEMNQDGVVSAEAAIAKRNKEVSEMLSLAIRHNQRALAEDAISKGMSIEQFRGSLLERIADKPLEAVEIDMNRQEQKQYSLMRAIESARQGRFGGFEAEVSQEIAKRYGKDPRGFYVPSMIFKRDVTTASPANGSNLVPTDHLAGEFVDALRANLVISGLGARMMQGLKGDVAIPALNAKTSVGFVAENSAPGSEGAPSFRQITMSPKTLVQYVDLSRKLMMQSDPSVEMIVRDDMTRQFAAKIDEVAIEGGGASEPTGILGTSGIGSVAQGTNGGAITYASCVNLEREVAIDNALAGNLAYLTNPKVVAAMRQTSRQSSGVEGNFILNDANTLLGYRVASTTLVPSDLTKGTSSGVCSALIFGNFADLMIGMFGGLDVLVDPYTGSSTGATRVALYQDIDVAVRHAESFAAIKDITT